MKTNEQQYANGVKSGLETKYTDLELRVIAARKQLNKDYKVNVCSAGFYGQKCNNLMGFNGLRNYLSLKEIEILLNLGNKQQTDKKHYLFGNGLRITLYVK